MNFSHADCLELLADPSTQNVLEKLGYEYSDRGLSDYRRTRPNIVPPLVQAIVNELDLHPVFPSKYQDHPPEIGMYIRKEGNRFVLMDIDKPSLRTARSFPTAQEAARAYIRKIVDSYWLTD